ncbi:MAG: InlB B-repeat-containing protein [Methanobrevibacter sp.]|nr:InlB B-repeat-containing protein [Methanobrevibacter sp.]
MAIAMLMFSLVIATSYAVSVPKDEKKDTRISIESKEKAVSYKITWNANGGKIGNKKTIVTTVKKGSKINKLSSSPKRSGYTFKGWYTKKTGGTKITKNTKPNKSVTYFARWTKRTSKVLNAEEKKLVGTWRKYKDTNWEIDYIFLANGKFVYDNTATVKSGNYKVSSGKITFTNVVVKYYYDGHKEYDYPNTVAEYKIEKQSKSIEVLKIAHLDYQDRNYLPLSSLWDSFTHISK